MKALIDLLHRKGCSCVVAKGDDVRTCWQRGVADLYDLLHEAPDFLRGARVADKVVGKGAAALLVAGGVASVYADTLSRPALALLEAHGVATDCDQVVSAIRNRANTGFCPLESRCRDIDDLDRLVAEVDRFVAELRAGKHPRVAPEELF